MRKLDYLSDSKDVAEMVERYQAGKLKQPDILISHHTIDELSGYIVNPPGLITDTNLIALYAEIVQEYRVKRKKLTEDVKALFILPEISDRRVNKASMMLEVSAVLNGRVEAIPSDISLASVVLCTSTAEKELWDKIVAEKLGAYEKLHNDAVNEAQLKQIRTITDQLDRNVEKEADTTKAADTLKVLWQQYLAMKPSTDVAAKHEALRAKFTKSRDNLEKRINKQVGLQSIG
jgi:hypothetical protein